MKRVSILVITLLSASLPQVCAAQAGSPTNTDSSTQTQTQTKQEKPNKPAKAKPAKQPIKPETGKKTTTSQDDAYALAARKGSPESQKTPPK
jgi:hypothetical protein